MTFFTAFLCALLLQILSLVLAEVRSSGSIRFVISVWKSRPLLLLVSITTHTLGFWLIPIITTSLWVTGEIWAVICRVVFGQEFVEASIQTRQNWAD